MTFEHTVCDVEEADLEGTLVDMGAQGWELAAAFPLEHTEGTGGEYAVSSLRLIFKRSSTASSRAKEVSERCGVDFDLAYFQAVLIVYFPASWRGTWVNVREMGGDIQEMMVEPRRAAEGTVHTVMVRNIHMDRHHRRQGLKYHLWCTEGDKRLEYTEFLVLPGINELDLVDELSS